MSIELAFQRCFEAVVAATSRSRRFRIFSRLFTRCTARFGRPIKKECSLWITGQISATLTSFSRTIDDYFETSKKELNAAKQEKAKDRIKAFKNELQDYRQQFDALKRSREEAVCS
jgi:hypothetical protein